MIRIDTPVGRALKRSMDVAGSALGVVVLSPVLLALGVLIKLDSPGPVFFRQVRVGKGGAPFRIWKFRSMRSDAESAGPGITVGGDPRVTRIGRFLRATKLDELPQLFNVLRGEMSLVGPRPEIPAYVELYDAAQRSVLEARPGITDPASLHYRDEEAVLAAAEDPHSYYRDVVMREKISLNLAYRKEATVFSDLGLILRTVAAVLDRRSRP